MCETDREREREGGREEGKHVSFPSRLKTSVEIVIWISKLNKKTNEDEGGMEKFGYQSVSQQAKSPYAISPVQARHDAPMPNNTYCVCMDACKAASAQGGMCAYHSL